jgi:hypothetical protein
MLNNFAVSFDASFVSALYRHLGPVYFAMTAFNKKLVDLNQSKTCMHQVTNSSACIP